MKQSVFKRLESIHELTESVHDRHTLLLKLKKELAAYSVFDFMQMHAELEKDCKYLPPVYKEMFRKKMSEHLFSDFKSITSNESFKNQDLDMEQFNDFIESFRHHIENMHIDEKFQMTVLYHLGALYNIFIRQTPPHPEGIPFPGGFYLEKVGGEYYCPVKDKQKDNTDAFCRFCVAKQAEQAP